MGYDQGFNTGYPIGYVEGRFEQAALDTLSDTYFGGIVPGGCNLYGNSFSNPLVTPYGNPLGYQQNTRTHNGKPAEVTSTGPRGEPMNTKCDGPCGYLKAQGEEGWFQFKNGANTVDVCWRSNCKKQFRDEYEFPDDPKYVQQQQVRPQITQGSESDQIRQLQQENARLNARLQQQHQHEQQQPRQQQQRQPNDRIFGMPDLSKDTHEEGTVRVQSGGYGLTVDF